MFKKSGNPLVEELIKNHKERSCDLSSLRAIKRDGKRLCAWCAEGQLHHGNQKYCNPECSQSAMATFYPQKEDSLRYLLFRQDWKCLMCQFDYRPYMDVIIGKDLLKYGAAFEISKLPWYYYKRLKDNCPKERKPEIDHIIPIFKGGTSLGLDNLNCICYTCHKTKTSKDLSGKRKKEIL